MDKFLRFFPGDTLEIRVDTLENSVGLSVTGRTGYDPGGDPEWFPLEEW